MKTLIYKPTLIKVRTFFNGKEIDSDEFERLNLNPDYRYPSQKRIDKKSQRVASITNSGMISYIDIHEDGKIEVDPNNEY